MMEVTRAPTLVDCGVGAVIKWSCGVIERCVNMSVSQQIVCVFFFFFLKKKICGLFFVLKLKIFFFFK